MAFLVKIVKKVRNNWKKSTFAAVVLSYGYSWTSDYLATQDLMRLYCERASEYGHQGIPVEQTPKTVTVILNPNANKRNALDDFEKYCAPILHLAGILVNIVKTESEGHAKSLVQEINNTDAIVVAGGDGTLCEVVTGLLRRTQENTNGLVPIGVLPLGFNNSFAKSLFPGGGHLEKVKSLADASMAIVEEATKNIDVMRVEIIEKDGTEQPKPVYALSGLKWGAFRDAEVSKDKYWYYGPLRKYVTYIFNGYKNTLTWKINADVTYSPPCEGCSNCLTKKVNDKKQKWFERFSKEKQLDDDRLRTLNPECSNEISKKIQTTDLVISTPNIAPSEEEVSQLHMSIGEESINYVDFVQQGWKSEKKLSRDVKETLNARVIEIMPGTGLEEESQKWFSIDNDDFEVKPIKITLLPKCITMFCKNENI